MMNNYLKYILIGIACIYFITVFERILNKDSSSTELIIEYATEKAQLKTKIEVLNNKIHDYELQILKIRIDVNNLTDVELDSTWSTIFE